MKKEFIVGLFLFFGLVIFGVTIFVIKDIRLQKGYKLNIYFEDVGNLAERAWVRMRGVTIGKVEKIDIKDNKARVLVWIDDKIKLYKTAKARISSTGILGVKYVEILQGEPTQEFLKDGDEIYITEGVVSIDSALQEGLNSLKKFTEILGGLQDQKGLLFKLKEIIDNTEQITKKLNSSIDEGQLKLTLKNIQDVSENINEFFIDTKKDITLAASSLKDLSFKLKELSENVKSTQTVAGQILSDKETAQNFKQTISSLKVVVEKADQTLNRINMFTTFWDYKFRYDVKNEVPKSDIGIEIYPKASKFYYLSVNNISSEETEGEKNNSLSIGIGGNFYDKITLYGGLIRSYSGVGIKLFPLGYNSKILELNLEAYNFSTTKSLAQIDLGLKFMLTRWLYLGARYEGISSQDTLNTFFNIKFEDEDIAYLLGLIGLTQ